MLLVFVVSPLVACAATAPVAETEAARIAQAMERQGAELTNLRAVPLRGRESERIVENRGFDIPGISIEGEKPAGTIRIYKGQSEAESERRLYGLLGKPGPETGLDYVTVVGTRGLLLHHQLPQGVAQRYINAFSSSP
jgi:hypothetical protein